MKPIAAFLEEPVATELYDLKREEKLAALSGEAHVS